MIMLQKKESLKKASISQKISRTQKLDPKMCPNRVGQMRLEVKKTKNQDIFFTAGIVERVGTLQANNNSRKARLSLL